MKTFTFGAGARLAALAAATVGAAALAACENPQPTAAPEQPTAAPPPGDATLMGAPTTRTPQYVGPSAPAEPPPPPPGYAPAPPPPPPPAGYAEAPPTAYPPGYGHRTGPGAPDQIVAMAPIPNPPETGWYYGRRYGATPEAHHARHHVWLYGGGEGASVGHGWRRPRHAYAHPPTRSAVASSPSPRPAMATPSHAAVAGAGAVGATQFRKPEAPAAAHRRHVDEATSAAASGGPTNTAANTTGAAAPDTEADRYKALEARLHDAFESVAVLNVPANMPAGQPSTVTLSVPVQFAAAVQRDAAQEGLSDAAASMNLLASLSGDGYAITPVETETVALTSNQQVTFQWQVTPGSGAKGPLKASARALVVSAGQYLNLGDKTQGDNQIIGKALGLGLLALIAAVILGWIFRRKPERAKPVVRRPAYDQYPNVPPHA